MPGLASRRHAKLVPPALCTVCVSVLLALGPGTSFFPWLFARFPPLRWFRWPHDYLLMTYFVLVVMAAAGLDLLWREPERWGRRLAILLVPYLVLGFIWLPHAVSGVALGIRCPVSASKTNCRIRLDSPTWGRNA